MYFALFVIVVISSSVNSLQLECEFKQSFTSYWGMEYSCVLKNLVTSITDKKVESVIGTHSSGKSNNDVVKVFAEHQNCPVLPTNLGAFFPNLKILYIMKSNVTAINIGDLDGLDKLITFDVSFNPITTIPKDFFKGHSHIKKISFYECQLTLIEPGALDHLDDLDEGHFQYNPCINFRGDQKHLIQNLMKFVTKCDGSMKISTTPIMNIDSDEDIFIYNSEEKLDLASQNDKNDKKCEPQIIEKQCDPKVITKTEIVEKKCDPCEKCEICKPMTIEKACEPKLIQNTKFIEKCSESKSQPEPELSFLQRHTYLINFVLISIIAVLIVLIWMSGRNQPFTYASNRGDELRVDF